MVITINKFSISIVEFLTLSMIMTHRLNTHRLSALSVNNLSFTARRGEAKFCFITWQRKKKSPEITEAENLINNNYSTCDSWSCLNPARIQLTLVKHLQNKLNYKDDLQYLTLPVKFLKILQPSELSILMVWAK